MPSRPVVLIQLSDIHLRKSVVEGSEDIDDDIRSRLKLDLQAGDVPVLAGVDGIVVTGDIAFAGDEAEYESARNWLDELCATVGCDQSSVWVVPGNHDVTRDVVRKSQIIRGIHEVIRKDNDPLLSENQAGAIHG